MKLVLCEIGVVALFSVFGNSPTIAMGAASPPADPPVNSATGTQGTDEATLTDAQRAALEKSADAAAEAAKSAMEKTNPQHLPAFPGAEGFGALATGGRGGTIYHVTNLNDDGPGSFRDAVSQPNRIIVFDVGGLIKIGKEIQVSSNITLAGQTAPGEGIGIYGNGVSLGGQSNIIVRYLRFREGIVGDAGKKALGMDNSSNLIIDHCSIEWGRWDDLGITVGSTAITVQNCIIAEAIHPQSFGALIDTVTNVTLSHNLWMSNVSRNPKVKGTVQFINNVVYNWGGTGLCGGHSGANHDLDVINNYFIKGPSSNNRFAGEFYATDHVYQAGNYVDLDADGQLNGKLAAPADFHRADETAYTLPTFVNAPAMHPAIAVTTESAVAAYARVAAGAGCSLRRDSVDLRLISKLNSLGTKGLTLPQEPKAPNGPNGKPDKTSPVYLAANAKVMDVSKALSDAMGKIKSGPAPAGAARNGIPDDWAKAHGLDPNDPAAATKLDPSGYMNIEVYCNSLAASAPDLKAAPAAK